jgi:small conductance mechanosensitive channel
MAWENVTNWLDETWVSNGPDVIMAAIVVIGGWLMLRLIRRFIQRWEDRVESTLRGSADVSDRERGQRLTTLADVSKLVASITVWLIVILTVMGVWGVPMTPFIAIGSTVGLAIGFGAQDLVRDVIAGFLILVEDQYSIGDVVTIAGVSGSVEAIQLRSTVLRDLDGNKHHVPNGQIKVASNLTSEFSRLVVDVAVAYATDIDRAIEVITDEALQFARADDWSQRFLADPEMLGVNELDESSVNIRVVMTLTTEDRWLVKREFLRRIKNRLDEEHIEIPFPHIKVIKEHPDV